MRVAISTMLVALATIALLSGGSSSQAATTGAESVIYTFPSTGSSPSPIIQASDGNFYGTVNNDVHGYPHGYVFRLTRGGALSIVYAFEGSADGGNPSSTLIEGNDGSLYGTNQGNGFDQGGVLFRLTLGGSYKVLHVFTASTDGSNLREVIQNKAGDLFGTAGGGGSSADGTVFEYSHDGTFSVVHTFIGTPDGAFPTWLLQASDGLIYGATQGGGTGSNDQGTIFRFDPADNTSFKTVASFPDGPQSQASTPALGLTEGADGALYGTTDGGGPTGYGTVYKVSLGSLPSVNFDLLDFNGGTEGGLPFSGLTLGGDGNFYGTTSAYGPNEPYLTGQPNGTIFQLTPGMAPSLDTLYTFSSPAGYATGAPIEAMDGNFYGVASLQIYKLVPTPAVPPPITIKASAPAIALGQSVTLTWQVNNAFSETMQNCYAHGDWSGSQGLAGTESFTPKAPGTYTYALTCGGVESALTTVTVSPVEMTGTKTFLTSSPGTNLKSGEAITISVFVKALSGIKIPTGTVTLASAAGGPTLTVALDGTGKAAYKGVVPPVSGTYSLYATYNAGPGFKGSVSPTITRHVGP